MTLVQRHVGARLSKLDLRSVIRDCRVALAPETGNPSFFRICFNWLLMRVFTLIATCSGLAGPAEAILSNVQMSPERVS